MMKRLTSKVYAKSIQKPFWIIYNNNNNNNSNNNNNYILKISFSVFNFVPVLRTEPN
jgi:hypothetical protein